MFTLGSFTGIQFYYSIFVFLFSACTERATKDKYVQGSKRQACVYSQLLQGHQ